MYPFLLHGLKQIGGSSSAPKYLQSFLGSFVNLVFTASSQLAGACATPEFLAYFDYFMRKDYGNDYYLKESEVVDLSARKKTIKDVIIEGFQQVVYCMNQPSGARGAQSPFWNIAYFDKYYFEGLFEDFCFPDGTTMQWESVSWLQKLFMKWFNRERTKTILTFPVESLSLLDDGKEYKDKEWADFAAEMYAEGHSFFTYRSDNVDSLSSCCRLRNEVQDNQFSYTLGAGGISTGSKCVMTINLNRLVQEAATGAEDPMQAVLDRLEFTVTNVHAYLKAFNSILKDRIKAGLLPIYDAGFINEDRQYLTIGINGLVEAAEFLGCEIKPNDEKYKFFVNKVLQLINNANKRDKEPSIMFNTEMVPAENLKH